MHFGKQIAEAMRRRIGTYFADTIIALVLGLANLAVAGFGAQIAQSAGAPEPVVTGVFLTILMGPVGWWMVSKLLPPAYAGLAVLWPIPVGTTFLGALIGAGSGALIGLALGVAIAAAFGIFHASR